jgi:carbamoyl-phosphate synthase large subunit
MAINILFTSIGRRVELVQAFRLAYNSLELEGHIVGTDIDPLAPALHHVDKPYIVPRFTSVDYLPTLLEICKQERIDIVFPLIDPDIPILSKYKTEFESVGAQLAVIDSDAAMITGDKWLTYQFFKNLELNTPASWLPNDVAFSESQYPLFIKPRSGSGAKDIFKISNARELEFLLDYVPDPIIQSFIAGSEITNDVICDLDGNVLDVVSRQRIEVRWGEVSKGVTIKNPEITDACIKITKSLPAIGPITVQCIMQDGIPYFTEINPRFGGGIPLGIAAGSDSPRWLIMKFLGMQEKIPPAGSYKTGVYMTRFDDSLFLTKDECDDMASNRI